MALGVRSSSGTHPVTYTHTSMHDTHTHEQRHTDRQTDTWARLCVYSTLAPVDSSTRVRSLARRRGRDWQRVNARASAVASRRQSIVSTHALALSRTLCLVRGPARRRRRGRGCPCRCAQPMRFERMRASCIRDAAAKRQSIQTHTERESRQHLRFVCSLTRRPFKLQYPFVPTIVISRFLHVTHYSYGFSRLDKYSYFLCGTGHRQACVISAKTLPSFSHYQVTIAAYEPQVIARSHLVVTGVFT